MSIKTKVTKFINDLNEKGIPVPLARLGGYPTLTGTMAIMSFTLALLGQIGKITQFIGEVDLTQSNYLFLICLGAYLGNKKLVGMGGASIEGLGKEEKPKK